jgi:hypothetical protein
MRWVQVALCLALLCLPAVAQDRPPLDPQVLEENTMIGRGVLCDTQEQMIRFVSLRESGKEAISAVRTINDEARNASACNMVMVMFTARRTLAEFSIHGHIVSLVEITVQAFGDGVVWKRVPETKQYTLVLEQGKNV